MIILVAGKYNPDYNRTKILINGLKSKSQIKILELPFKKKKYLDKKLFKQYLNECDIVYCPPFSHKYVKYIKRKSSKPVVFDPLISNYLTKVYDYKSVSKWSPRAYKNFLKDKIPFKAVDLLIADTQEHKNYYHNTFKIPLDKIQVLPIGAIQSDFSPEIKQKNNIITVGFYGGFIPLQGVKQIIETAEILKNHTDIQFKLIGTGFQYEEMKDLVKLKRLNNVIFEGWVAYNELSNHLKNYDICLGIFGENIKSNLVIPNKIYHYAAMRKPIITMESKAIKELFSHGENIFLTENKPAKIAEAILLLKSDEQLQEQLAQNASNLLHQELNEGKIADRFLEFLKALTPNF